MSGSEKKGEGDQNTSGKQGLQEGDRRHLQRSVKDFGGMEGGKECWRASGGGGIVVTGDEKGSALDGIDSKVEGKRMGTPRASIKKHEYEGRKKRAQIQKERKSDIYFLRRTENQRHSEPTNNNQKP